MIQQKKAFISHSSNDDYFVNLLVALLDFHSILSWHSYTDIKAGQQWETRIENEITEAEKLLIVVSKNAVQSNWLKVEITTFKNRKPESEIIPILIDDTDLEEVFPGLSKYQAIDFTKSMLDGFRKLMQVFNKEFLPSSRRIVEHRKAERRSREDRRLKPDRRNSKTIDRLRYGFQLHFFTNKNIKIQKNDRMSMTTENLVNTVNILQPEVLRYEFLSKEKGVICDSEIVLQESVTSVWQKFNYGYLFAINIIYAIAEEIYLFYDIKEKERRKPKADRRLASDRRKK